MRTKNNEIKTIMEEYVSEQISVISVLAGGLSLVATALASLFWYFWKDDRRRIKDLEDNASGHKGITRLEVEIIVGNIKAEFKEDHREIREDQEGILKLLGQHRNETRDDFKEIRRLLMAKYSGPDRRDNEP